MKWKFTPDMVERLVGEQREIFKQAFDYVKPGGALIYITCSILKRENEDQAEYFLKNFALTEEKRFQTIPKKGEMDGFFGVAFRKT
jgi:16S rRNA (cytosine967-C5)-methyltransferase